MKELNDAAEQIKLLFGTDDESPVSGDWAQWYHEGIPDEPEKVRENKRRESATKGHCLDCTAMSGCYFIDGEKTFPKYPHHPNCHCKKFKKSPHAVTAFCNLDKFTGYSFTDSEKGPFMEKLGFTVDYSEYLKSEFERQAKEKYISGDYILGKLNQHGQRINIKVTVFNKFNQEKYFITGWMVRPNGLITCNTPFGDK